MNKAQEDTKMTKQEIFEFDDRAYNECARIQQIASVLCLLREAIEEDDLVRWPAVMLLIDLVEQHRHSFIELTDQMAAAIEQLNK